MTVKRGEIYWVEFDPVRGSEQGGLRPALVVQNDIGNRYSPTTVVAAITRTLPSKP
jgi:mRNA interferase MazF